MVAKEAVALFGIAEGFGSAGCLCGQGSRDVSGTGTGDCISSQEIGVQEAGIEAISSADCVYGHYADWRHICGFALGLHAHSVASSLDDKRGDLATEDGDGCVELGAACHPA